MALPNNDPIYSKVGAIGAVRVATLNQKSDGAGTIGTDMFLAFSADSTNGSYVQRVRFSVCNSAAGTAATSTATVGRVYISTVNSGSTTSSNTHLWGEVSIPSLSTDGDAGNNPLPSFEVPLNFALPPNYYILVSIGTASVAANTEFKAIVIAGNY